MLIFAAEGPHSVDDRDVIAVYSDHRMGGYVRATLILSSGEEVSGMVLTAALDRLEREIADTISSHRQRDCCGLSRERLACAI